MQSNQVFTVMPSSKRWRRKSRRWQIPWSSFQPSNPQVNQDSPHCCHIAHELQLWPPYRLSNPPIVQSGALASFYESGCSEVLNALDRGTLFPKNSTNFEMPMSKYFQVCKAATRCTYEFHSNSHILLSLHTSTLCSSLKIWWKDYVQFQLVLRLLLSREGMSTRSALGVPSTFSATRFRIHSG